jgi:subtilisin family serine protease
MGTIDRADDTIAAFSSRGPTAIDHLVKPDLVAPGVGIESLSDPESTFYSTKSPYLLSGTVATSYLPYLSLSGTSMAAPVVSGTVALMLQANPSLTPRQVKAILRHTAESSPQYDRLTEGAGFLNAKSAVESARQSGLTIELIDPWLIDLLLHGGDDGDTFATSDEDGGVVWGTDDDGGVVWGTNDDGGVVWGTTCGDPSCEPVVWGQP